ncbi:MAG TPA: sigma-70 family RNA polymerase sigma factor [Pyrinomonadaceae bacterium]|nr:sigma-70 family RNA polymerase sigma factor [Pyrinomonadaceae bacterium]
MSRKATAAAAANTERLLRDGVARLLGRATDARALDAAALTARVGGVLEKYLLRHRPEASAEEIGSFLDALRADDLCLVVACERGDDAAWTDLMEQFRATVLSAARTASANEDAAEELAQSVWADLYGLRARADGSVSGKLAYYSGCGSLGGWLRAVVGQLAVDRHRKTARLVQTEEATDFDRLAREGHEETDNFTVAAAPDPEHALAGRQTADALERALAHAVAALDAEDRLLIKLYYFDDLRLREAGAVLGVHEATASRRLTRLHTEVRKSVEAFLIKEHGWTKQETARSLADAATHLDTDLRRMLAGAETSQASERREELYE